MAVKLGRKPKENKAELQLEVVRLKCEGEPFNAIASKLQISHDTTKRYWNDYQRDNQTVDVEALLFERRQVCERLLSRTIRQYYTGEVDIKAIAIAMEMANKMSGIDLIIAKSLLSENLPPLLEIVVHNIDIEMPPSSGDR
jgi:hypothetical protein